MTLYLPFWKTTIKKDKNMVKRNKGVFLSKTCKPFTIKSIIYLNYQTNQWRYEIRMYKRNKSNEKEKEVLSFPVIVCNNPEKVERFVNTAIENFSSTHEGDFSQWEKMSSAREFVHHPTHFEKENENLYFDLPFCTLPFKITPLNKFNFDSQDIVELLPNCVTKIIHREKIHLHTFKKKVYALIVGRRSDEHSSLYTIETISGSQYSVREYWVTKVEKNEELAFKEAHLKKFPSKTKKPRQARGSIFSDPVTLSYEAVAGTTISRASFRMEEEDERPEEEQNVSVTREDPEER